MGCTSRLLGRLKAWEIEGKNVPDSEKLIRELLDATRKENFTFHFTAKDK